jgi:potassium-transporting ATPase KdpC subunit
MRTLITSIKALLIFSILLGVIYPFAIYGIAKLAFPSKASGSLIMHDGRSVGSELIGQSFNKPEFFHSRPSQVSYDAAGSGASNLGPSSKKLMDLVSERIKQVRDENNLDSTTQIPPDMVLASASGLDPHISIQNAILQAGRIEKSRGISKQELHNLIMNNIDDDFLGIWGAPGVNVLKLNIALSDLLETNDVR